MAPFCGMCGVEYKDDQNYCTGCGVRLSPPEPKPRKNEKKKIEAISPCHLEHLNFLERMFAYNYLFTGNWKLKFCSCPICDRAFREMLASVMSADEPEKFDPADPVIIKLAQEKDQTKIVLDMSKYFSNPH